jgi:hypothetical protein
MRRLTERESKLVAVGLLVAAIAAVWLGVVSPLVGGFVDRRHQRQELVQAYVRDRRVLAGIPVWRSEAEEQRRTAGRFAVQATSQAQATEVLKERITKLAADEGGVMKAVQDTQVDANSPTVRVRADLQLTLSQLYESLKRLETEEPYVVVEYLAVDAVHASETGGAAPLDVRLEVSADWRAAAPRQP